MFAYVPTYMHPRVPAYGQHHHHQRPRPAPLSARDRYLASLAQFEAAEAEYQEELARRQYGYDYGYDDTYERELQYREALIRQREAALRRRQQAEEQRALRERIERQRQIERQHALEAQRRQRAAQLQKQAAFQSFLGALAPAPPVQQQAYQQCIVPFGRPHAEQLPNPRLHRRPACRLPTNDQEAEVAQPQNKKSGEVDLGDLLGALFGVAPSSPSRKTQESEPAPKAQPRKVQEREVDLASLLTTLLAPQSQAGSEPRKTEEPVPLKVEEHQPRKVEEHQPRKVEEPQPRKVEEPRPREAADTEPALDVPAFFRALMGELAGLRASGSRSTSAPAAGPSTSTSKPAPEAAPKKVESTSAPASQPAQPAPAPRVHFPLGDALKTALASRLDVEREDEMRDVARALMASLFDNHKAAESNSRPSPLVPSSSSYTQPEPEDKGKGKQIPVTEEPKEPTAQDVQAALDSVRSIDAHFSLLSNEFEFPRTLDFTPPSSPSSSPRHSALELGPAQLAYTARNAPLHNYTHALTALLGQLDAVESYGNEEVRSERRRVVGRVEGRLEEIEGEVEGRWAQWRAVKEDRAESAPVDESAPAAAAESTSESAPTPPAAPVKEAAVPLESVDEPAASAEVIEESSVPMQSTVESTVDEAATAPAAGEPVEHVPTVLVSPVSTHDESAQETAPTADLNASQATITPAQTEPASSPVDAAHEDASAAPFYPPILDASALDAPSADIPSDTESESFLLRREEQPEKKPAAASDAEDAVLVDGGSEGGWSEVEA